MPEEGTREDPTGGAAEHLPVDIDEEHEEAGTSPPAEASSPKPPPVGPRSAGTPADWLEKVRRQAPGLLASPTRRAAPPPTVPHGPVAAGAEAAQPTVAAVDRPRHGAGQPPPRTKRALAPQPPDETDGGVSPEIAADGPVPLELRADERPAPTSVPPWPAEPEGASERGSAERVADQSGEAWSRPEETPEPEPVHQAAPRPATVGRPQLADTLTEAYQAPQPADAFAPIAPAPAYHLEHGQALEAEPEPVLRGEPWLSPATPPSPQTELDPWPTMPPANAPVRGVAFAGPASLVSFPTANAPAPSEAMPPDGPASRWPTLPPADPTEDAFEVATALRSRDRWSRLVREQESA